jgi:peptidoglycan/LPS O-acetylase OafA/YrhL
MTNILLVEKNARMGLRSTLVSFYANRVRRIVPAPTVLCLITVAMFPVFYLPLEFIRLSGAGSSLRK